MAQFFYAYPSQDAILQEYLDDSLEADLITSTSSTTLLPPSTTSTATGSRGSFAFNNSHKIDLGLLWQWLERSRANVTKKNLASVVGLDEAKFNQAHNRSSMTTWELVILQAVLLFGLVALSVLWAFCCKKKCVGSQPLITELSEHVVTLARKISTGSRDLPPSYSKVDLTQLGLTINDHLNPPPHYDNLNDSPSSTESPPESSSRRSDTGADETESEATRRSSLGLVSPSFNSDSQRISRVTFAQQLEEGPSRKESSQSLPLQSVLVKQRKKSSCSYEGSASLRRVSFIDEATGRHMNHRPDPTLEQRLQIQLDFVKKAGELAEFVSAGGEYSKHTSDFLSCHLAREDSRQKELFI